MSTLTKSSMHAGGVLRSHPRFDLRDDDGGGPDWSKPILENFDINVNSRGCEMELISIVRGSDGNGDDDRHEPVAVALLLRLDYGLAAENCAVSVVPILEWQPDLGPDLNNLGKAGDIGNSDNPPYHYSEIGVPWVLHLDDKLKVILWRGDDSFDIEGEIPQSLAVSVHNVGQTGSPGYAPAVTEVQAPAPPPVVTPS